ncbi:hypothetical protein NECAME_17300 [Necator americanus]|uniref:Peptidase A2 domain-containing protein n=1 Tax=Necator americanus TaxID=51031 RepID=W2TQN6_NECAM|nr:hypothetical protein NECAME_17300 [Necator americanus]ETN83989.1 hypothetical protein NECAME_17300 [Necator americanus]
MSYELNATSKLIIEALEKFTETVDRVEEFQGIAKVRNEKSGDFQDIEILLDTGADRSFIQKQLADELELPIMNKGYVPTKNNPADAETRGFGKPRLVDRTLFLSTTHFILGNKAASYL